jgi:acyl-CoA thioester hydrolase
MSVILSDNFEFKIRFNEADPLGIVWHGNYLSYFEDGRESFGNKYGLSYMDIYNYGFTVPIVDINCSYKRPLHYGDSAFIETIFVETLAVKLIFNYKISLSRDKSLVAEGSSTQVFLDLKNKQLQLTLPDFFEKWKEKWLVKNPVHE